MQHFNFFGIQITDANIDISENTILEHNFSNTNYICFPDAFTITISLKKGDLQSVLNNSFLTLPDGKPSELMGKRKGLKNIKSVSGYWLCRKLLESDLSHFFLGSTPNTLKLLSKRIEKEYPKAKIKGYASPRFISDEEARAGICLEEEFKRINESKPDLIWMGISSPKQDYIMHHHLPLLKHGIMLGIGGVFDYLSGEVTKSPEWVKKIGMRWAWRLAKEPKRMWRKYFIVFKVLSWRYILEYIRG